MELALLGLLIAILATFLLPGKAGAGVFGGARSDFAGQPVAGSPWEAFAPSQFIVNKVRESAIGSGVREELVASVIMVESSFRPNAENAADPSFGLMGVSPLIAQAFGGWDRSQGTEGIKNLDVNLRAGTGFLRFLLNKYGNLESAVQAYNLGETKFDRGVRVPAYLGRVRRWANTFGMGF